LGQDGGLYFPEAIPSLSSTELESWRGLSYPAILHNILGLFISEDEVPFADLGIHVEHGRKVMFYITQTLNLVYIEISLLPYLLSKDTSAYYP
jgi:threonine synthase